MTHRNVLEETPDIDGGPEDSPAIRFAVENLTKKKLEELFKKLSEDAERFGKAYDTVDLSGSTGLTEWPKEVAIHAALSCLILPESVKTIEGVSGALTEISGGKAQTIQREAFKNCLTLKKVSFPELTEIGESAFEGCKELAEVSFPNVKEIGWSAFRNCQKLTTADLPEAVKISPMLFWNCKNLVSVNIPKAVKIPGSAFILCEKLTAADFPKVTHIGQMAFLNCKALAAVNMPKAREISANAFESCKKLKEACFPELMLIGNGAFQGCKQLASLTIPKAKTIDNHAFALVNSSIALILGAAAPRFKTSGDWTFLPADPQDSTQLDSSAFGGITEITLYVPSAKGFCEEHYGVYKYWKNNEFSIIKDKIRLKPM